MAVDLSKKSRPAIAGLAALFMLSTVACNGDEAEGVRLAPTAVDLNSTVTSHVVNTTPVQERAEQALLYSVYNGKPAEASIKPYLVAYLGLHQLKNSSCLC